MLVRKKQNNSNAPAKRLQIHLCVEMQRINSFTSFMRWKSKICQNVCLGKILAKFLSGWYKGKMGSAHCSVGVNIWVKFEENPSISIELTERAGHIV